MYDWESKAKQLSFGQKRKIPHCSNSSTAYISNSTKGLGFYCFRCQEKAFVPHGKLSSKDYVRMASIDKEVVKQDKPHTLPMTHKKVDKKALAWILKTGLSPEQATEEFSIGWNNRTSRVVIPLMQNGKETGWVARAVDGRKPKYLIPRDSSNSAWYYTEFEDTPLVVVEDVLSAIKVKRAGFNSIAVLGTHIKTEFATIMQEHPVIGWFDGDDAGRDGWVKLRKTLSPFGTHPTRIKTEMDPKAYDLRDIQEYVERAYAGFETSSNIEIQGRLL